MSMIPLQAENARKEINGNGINCDDWGKTCNRNGRRLVMKAKFVICTLMTVMIIATVFSCWAESYEVPELETLSPGQTVRLKESRDEGFRVMAYYGPGKTYMEAGGYKPYKQNKITAYFNEGGWVLIHLRYQTAKERYVYIADNAFESLSGVPRIDEMQYYLGKTVSETAVRLGPSFDFISADNVKSIPAGTNVKVFFQKNGFAYAEFRSGKGNVRMWIPLTSIQIYDSGTYEPVERQKVPVNDSNSKNEQESNKSHCPNHPDAEERWEWGGYTFKYTDSKYHDYYFLSKYTCEICGYQTSEWEKGYREEHSFIDGICEGCGYVRK